MCVWVTVGGSPRLPWETGGGRATGQTQQPGGNPQGAEVASSRVGWGEDSEGQGGRVGAGGGIGGNGEVGE